MSGYLKALQAELGHVEQIAAAATEKDLADAKARIKDVKAEIARVQKTTKTAEVEINADVNKVETAVNAAETEVATATKA